jgi:ABC-type phosphonate transport system ATPase subunit
VSITWVSAEPQKGHFRVENQVYPGAYLGALKKGGSMRLALVIAAAVLAAACSSPSQPMVDYRDVDEAKMSQVEENAQRTGVRVFWVNPPRKPAGATP